MVHRPGWRLSAVLVAALIAALSVSAVALASGLSKPAQKSPHRGAHVHAGAITFKVSDPGVPKDVRPLDIAIAPNKKTLSRISLLKGIPKSCASKCDYVAMHPWKGHAGMWIFTNHDSFPGFWAVTPGTYYWQAEHVAPLCNAPHCLVMSAVHVFHVVG
jgi:hypothetical protein